MTMSVVGIFIVLIAGLLVWLSRGFFSAFLHLICTIIAGAIAFAAWEPAAYWLLDQGGTGWLGSAAWGLGLAIPFAVSLILLRVIVDQTIRANVQFVHAVDMVGGAICGTAAGIIAAGIVMISVGTLRLPTDFWGATRLAYATNGSMERDSSIFFPADKIVSTLYGHLSVTTFSESTPLAYQYPDLADVPTSLRLSFGEGRARNTTRPGDFNVMGRFTVGGTGQTLQSLLSDRWVAAPQQVTDVNGDPFPQTSRIEGFVIKFNAGAKEKGDGKVSIGAAQIRLVIARPDPSDAERFEDPMTVYPVAGSCQAEAATPQAARFRFDGRDIFLAGVGGASEATFAFEFVVPAEYVPVSLYVKNVRTDLINASGLAPRKLTTAAERDMAIATGALLGGSFTPGAAAAGGGTLPGGGDLDSSQAERLGTGSAWREAPPGLTFSNLLPFTIQLGTQGGLEVDTDNGNLIVYGEHTFDPEQIKNTRGIDRKLQVQKLITTPDTTTVLVDVSLGQRMSLLGQAAAAAEQVVPPLLRDANGQIYEPIGYIYEDATKIVVRFKPGEPIRSLSQLAQAGAGITRSRSDQKLKLIFRVNKGVPLASFGLGTKIIAEFNPPYLPPN